MINDKTTYKPFQNNNDCLCFSYESGVLEDPKNEAPVDLYNMTKSPESAPDTAEQLQIEFKGGTSLTLFTLNNLSKIYFCTKSIKILH